MTGEIRVAARRAAMLLLLVGIAAVPARSAFAQGMLELRADLDRKYVGVGQAAMLTLTVLAEGVDIPPIILPPIPGAQVDRLGTSQGFSWVNGRVIRTLTVGFHIRGEAEGDLVIPAVHISSGGVEAESTPLVLHVGKTPPPPKGEAPELFARLTLDRPRAYWNECVTARYTIYSRVRLDGAPVWDPPAAAGFWNEVLGPSRTQRTTVDGVEYDATEVRVAYFPTRTGRLTVGPARVHVRVLRRVTPPDPWSMLGLPETQVEEGVIDTERASLEVLPLPPGAPPTFKGAVGKFAMDVRVDRATVRAGEPVTVVTALRGEGNIGSAGDPDVAASVPVRMYVGGANTSLDRSGERLRGERRREVTFVPEAPGQFAILPVRYSWFDPEGQRYRTQLSDSIRVLVRPSDTPSDSLHAAPVMGPVAALRSRPGRRGPVTLEPPAGSRAVALVSIVAFVGAVVGKRVRERSERDPKRRRAAALAALLAEFSAIDVASADGAPAAVRIGAIVRRALGLRYNTDIDGRSADEALAQARAAGATEEDLAELSRLLHALDLLAFAPPDARGGAGLPEREAAERLVRRYREEVA